MTTTRQMERTVLHELLEDIREHRRTSTEIVSHLRGLAVNHVLATELARFDAAGVITRTWLAPFGSVAVANHSSADVTVAAGGPQDGPPPQGTGLHLVPAGAAAVINLAGTTLTLYGTAAERVSIQVFAKPQPPCYGRVLEPGP